MSYTVRICPKCDRTGMLCRCDYDFIMKTDAVPVHHSGADPTAALHARIAELEASNARLTENTEHAIARREEAWAAMDSCMTESAALHARIAELEAEVKTAEIRVEHYCARAATAERERDALWDLLAEAGARLSLHYANPIDASVCDRILAIDAARRATTAKEKP